MHNMANSCPSRTEAVAKTYSTHHQNIGTISPTHRHTISNTLPQHTHNIANTSSPHHPNITTALPHHRHNIANTSAQHRLSITNGNTSSNTNTSPQHRPNIAIPWLQLCQDIGSALLELCRDVANIARNHRHKIATTLSNIATPPPQHHQHITNPTPQSDGERVHQTENAVEIA